MPRPQFTLRTVLVAMLVVGAFFGGAVFGTKRERQRLASQISAERDQLAKKEAEFEQMTSFFLQTAHEHAEALAPEHPDIADKWRCFYSRED